MKDNTPAHLDTLVSSGIRVCLAAKERNLDISGSFIRTGGEPLTPTKAEIFKDAGVETRCHFAMAEVGHVGMACAHPEEVDDVHLLKSKLAVIQKLKMVGSLESNI
ncbi:hypothetical protein ACFLRM_06630, partial [Acidobacteriota bacterium]